MENEKKISAENKSKNQSSDTKFKLMRNRMQELESKNKDNEHKINEQQKKIR